VSERDLRETYLPAFKDLVIKGGVEEVMTAYNRVDGVPAGASDRLINEILRGEWGYQGIITSDCWAVPDFYEPGRHGYSPDAATAAAIAVKTGMDTECGESFAYLPEAVSRGLITEEEIDVNLRRLLLERFRLGEMDGVSLWGHLADDIVEGEEHKALALKMAHETMVLLQNNGVLPLKADSRIAIVGPNADDEDMMWGNYNPIPKETITLVEAMRERIPDVKYIRGCGILGYEHRPMPSPNHPFAKYVDMTDEEIDALAASYAIDKNTLKQYVERQQQLRSNFEPALDIKDVLFQLQDVDIVVFAGGISPEFEGEEMPVQVPGFSGGDRTDIELPGVQRELIEALHNDGKKVVLVNFSGSAVGLVPESENCDAILQAWYPGQMGGTAIADVLFGDVNPSGRLPLTFYKSVDQLPHFENYDMEGHTYRYFRGEPLYKFGHGLSYTTFEYGEAKVKNGKIVIPVTNTGAVEGTEVVQLYIRKPDDAQGPLKTLRGFERVTVAPGKTVKVEIPLTDETFNWWDETTQNVNPVHGTYELLYGGSSADDALKVLEYEY
jgi:beta-glucosidase